MLVEVQRGQGSGSCCSTGGSGAPICCALTALLSAASVGICFFTIRDRGARILIKQEMEYKETEEVFLRVCLVGRGIEDGEKGKEVGF